jgi:4-diphosphocytidyl-2C-methyl-D-erythritol kinase
LTEALKKPIGEWQGVVKNDFEPHIFEAHPVIAELKQTMLEAGAIYASMSGSGSAVFGIFENRPNFDGVTDKYLKITNKNQVPVYIVFLYVWMCEL